MAKKTTAGKGSSRRKKSAENIEDAEIVESTTPTSEDQLEAATEQAQDDTVEVAEDTDANEAASSDAAEATAEGATDPSEPSSETTTQAESTVDLDAIKQDDADVETVEETADATEEEAEAKGSDEDASDQTDGEASIDEASSDPNEATDDESTGSEATDRDDLEEQATSEADESLPEDTSSSAPEPIEELAPPVPPPSAPEPKKASAVPMIFGGLLAGAIGFGAAYVWGDINPPPGPEPVDLSGIEQSIEAQSQRLDDVAASIPEVSAPTVDTSELEASIASVLDSVAALDARVTALESRPAGEGSTSDAVTIDPAVVEDLNALKATVGELDALKAAVAALQDANEAAKDAASSEAAAALQRAAITRVQTALDTGAPFADAVGELQALGLDVPETLSNSAVDGVPTLASLQDAFPEAARAALAADRAEAAAAGETGSVVDFFRSQLGARSLTPQEGDSSDAVLSRAEHALREGRLPDALAEIETLPDVSQPAMADWSTIVAVRADALSAAQALMDSLN